MSLPPDQPPIEKPKLTPEERRARQADRLTIIRLRMLIFREMDERGITTPGSNGQCGTAGGTLIATGETLAQVQSRLLPVGNLYVNRHITGAMVARQPFGGNRLSGTGTKAGGPDYLLQFVEPRVVTEDTMRHGLVV